MEEAPSLGEELLGRLTAHPPDFRLRRRRATLSAESNASKTIESGVCNAPPPAAGCSTGRNDPTHTSSFRPHWVRRYSAAEFV